MLLPRRNEKDLADIPKRTMRGLNIMLVDRMDEVLEQALLPGSRT